MSDQTVEFQSDRAVVVLVGSCNPFSIREIQEMIQKQLCEDNNPIPDNITFVERPEFPELLLESMEDMERREAKFFKKLSYQQQQKDLRFLNKRRKK